MQLMQTLSEQLDGNMKIENNDGAMIKVCLMQEVMERTVHTSENINNVAS